jgi:syntaxin 1B/2/3
MDMQMLVEQQGEHLNTIVENADTTVGELERGNKHVDSAIKKARATRAKKWGCFFLTIILLVVIAILIWWFAFQVSYSKSAIRETVGRNLTAYCSL